MSVTCCRRLPLLHIRPCRNTTSLHFEQYQTTVLGDRGNGARELHFLHNSALTGVKPTIYTMLVWCSTVTWLHNSALTGVKPTIYTMLVWCSTVTWLHNSALTGVKPTIYTMLVWCSTVTWLHNSALTESQTHDIYNVSLMLYCHMIAQQCVDWESNPRYIQC